MNLEGLSGRPLPSFSVVTPSLNQLRFLKVCVASVVVQDYPAVEQIVADGGSSDGTGEYLASVPGCVSCWRSEVDNGQSDALNWAVAQATGEWVGWQNADDYYLPGALWGVARAITSNPTARVVVGDVTVVDEEGSFRGSIGVDPVAAARWLAGFWPYNQGVFVHRSVLDEVGPFDVELRLHMDTDLLARVGLLNPPVVYLDAALGAFRKHSGGKTFAGAADPASQRERSLLEARYGRRLWPQSTVGRLVHRLQAHWARIRCFGAAHTVRRAGDRTARSPVVRMVR